MVVKVYNLENREVGEINLADNIFGRDWNPDLIHQVLVSKASNKRQPLAHAKSRADVIGGGKKPWRQKGTGRARHGSIRSPLWKGGGVTFGPTKEKNFYKKINKKMLKAALYSALSKKLEDGELRVIDGLKTDNYKTKEIFAKLKNLKTTNVLLVPAPANKMIYRACSNIPKVKCLSVYSLNTEDVIKYKSVLLDKEAAGLIK